MKLLLHLIALIIPIYTQLSADEEVAAPVLAEQIQQQITDYETSVRANTQRIISASTEEERNRYRASIPSAGPYAAKVLALILSQPQHPDAAVGLSWLISQCLSLPEGQQALELLRLHHAASSGIAPALRQMEHFPASLVNPVLDAVIANNVHPEELAAAHFARACHYQQEAETATDPTTRQTAQQQAQTTFQKIITDFPTTEIQGFPLADIAATRLFELTHLNPGAAVPEITGTDSAQQTFRLSDYRGHHVLLVFWGDWCHGCHGLLPQLSEFAQRFKDQRLVLLGVNTDPPATARQAITAQPVPWRCWLDGSTSGPITSLWSLRHFPTLYLISPEGIIMQKDTTLTAVSQALEKAFSPAE
jgi:peroxiredoxin